MGAGRSRIDVKRDDIIATILSKDDAKRLDVVRMRNLNQCISTAVGMMPIHLAILAGDLDTVRRVIAGGVDLNLRSQGMCPPLHLAACASTVEIVKELLKHRDLDVNAVEGKARVTALMAAVSYNVDGLDRPDDLRAEIIATLLEDSRCDAQLADVDGFSALTYAAYTGRFEVAKVLLMGKRAAGYILDDLVVGCKVAVNQGHTALCDLIVNSLSVKQRAQLKEKISQSKDVYAATATHEGRNHNTDRVTAMLNQFDAFVNRHTDANGQRIDVGDIVKICVNRDTLLSQLGEKAKIFNEKAPAKILLFDEKGNAEISFGICFDDGGQLRISVSSSDLVLASKESSYVGVDSEENIIRCDDTVRVCSDEKTVKMLLGDDWNDRVRNALGQPGRIIYFELDGSPYVVVAMEPYIFNPKAITLVTSVTCGDGSMGKVGDTFFVTTSKPDLKALQSKHFFGWQAGMETILGREVVIQRIHCDCFIPRGTPQCAVKVCLPTGDADGFWMNPGALQRVRPQKTSANEAPSPQQRSRSPPRPVVRKFPLPTPKVPVTTPKVPLPTSKVLVPTPEVSELKPKDSVTKVLRAGVHVDLVARDSEGTEIKPGDVLLFKAKREQLMEQLEKGPTGWSEELVGLVLSRALLVIGIRPDGDLDVAIKAFVTGDRTTATVLKPETTKVLSHADQTGIDADGKHLRKGETVTLLDDEGTFRELQNRSGRNWNDEILPFLGKPVVIQFFDRNGDIRAMIGRMGYLKSFNPKATKKVESVKCSEGRDITVGSSVAVAVSLAELKSLQTEQFGGWKAGMEALLQGTLTISEISCNVQLETQSPSCMVRVGHHGSDFWLNPMALRQTKSPVLVLPQPSPPHAKFQTRPSFGPPTHGGSGMEQPDEAAKKDRKISASRPPIPVKGSHLSQSDSAEQLKKPIQGDMELRPNPNEKSPVPAKPPRLAERSRSERGSQPLRTKPPHPIAVPLPIVSGTSRLSLRSRVSMLHETPLSSSSKMETEVNSVENDFRKVLRPRPSTDVLPQL